LSIDCEKNIWEKSKFYLIDEFSTIAVNIFFILNKFIFFIYKNEIYKTDFLRQKRVHGICDKLEKFSSNDNFPLKIKNGKIIFQK